MAVDASDESQWVPVTEHPRLGLKFRNDETGHEFMCEVFDKYPQLGTLELDGRHYVEVSVQLWAEIMASQGYHTVDPNETEEINNG